MNTDFEPVMDALLQHLDDSTPRYLPWSRRVQHWSQVTVQPAGFLRRIGATDEPGPGAFVITTLECELWLYCNAGKDPERTPDAELARLETTVRGCFAPDTDYGENRFTLGGLVYWCRIEGRSDYSPGDQSGQAISRIPVRITLP